MPDNLKTYFYQTYGMQIESSVPLPDLVKGGSKADVAIRYGKITDSDLNVVLADASIYEKPSCTIRTTARAMLVEWKRVGKFLIRDGKQVTVEPEAEVLEEDLHPFLTGPVLSILLHQRGNFVLHASAVLIDGRAAIFLGAKGYGKSTLAASLQVRGHRLIADDIVPVSFTGNAVTTAPGFPRIKLYEDSIAAVGQKAANFPLVHRFVEKRSFRYREDFSTEPIPLGAVYILSASEEIGLEKPSAAEAFVQVMANTFLNRFLDALNCHSDYFEKCRHLVQSVPVRKLNRPHEFEKINEICSLIEENTREMSATSKTEAPTFVAGTR